MTQNFDYEYTRLSRFLMRYNEHANEISLIQIFNLAAYIVKGFLARSSDAIFIIRL